MSCRASGEYLSKVCPDVVTLQGQKSKSEDSEWRNSAPVFIVEKGQRSRMSFELDSRFPLMSVGREHMAHSSWNANSQRFFNKMSHLIIRLIITVQINTCIYNHCQNMVSVANVPLFNSFPFYWVRKKWPSFLRIVYISFNKVWGWKGFLAFLFEWLEFKYMPLMNFPLKSKKAMFFSMEIELERFLGWIYL